MHFTPVNEALGARVEGADPALLATPEVAAEVAAALDRYSVLVFPELFIDDDRLLALGGHLGSVVHPPHGSIEGYPGIVPISRDPEVYVFAKMASANDYWHADGTSYECPDKATFLAARTAPDVGEGNTEFASAYAAYEALPEEMKARLDGLHVRHTFENAQRHAFPDPSDKQVEMWKRVEGRTHPIVWRRADGRASLLLGSTAESIVELDHDEGRALIAELNEWITQDRFTLTHVWREGDLVIFDNTAVLHRARPYAPTSPRLMHRITLTGEVAVSA